VALPEYFSVTLSLLWAAKNSLRGTLGLLKRFTNASSGYIGWWNRFLGVDSWTNLWILKVLDEGFYSICASIGKVSLPSKAVY
jgi:hypothetical protein